MNLPTYNQGDPKWRRVALGSTTIGEMGCAVTSLAMFLANMGIDETPESVVAKLVAVGGIQPDGGLLWSLIPSVWPTVSFIDRVFTVPGSTPNMAGRQETTAAVKRIRRLISLGQPVLVNVDNTLHDGIADHWVVAHDVNPAGQLVISNPDGGKVQVFDERYGDPLRGVYGYTILIGYPKQLPLWSSEGPESAALPKAAEVARLSRALPDSRMKVLASEIVTSLI